MLLIYGFAFALTAVLVFRAGHWGGHTPDLGSISPQWIAAHNASRHASAG